MTGTVPVFVNDRCARVPAGAPAADAVAQVDAALADALRNGTAYLTDARGLRLEGAVTAHPGLILRVVVTARRPAGEADAQP